VVAGGQRCVAAASNDTAPVLLALGASVRIVSPRGQRDLALRDFYDADGVHNTVLKPDELLTEVRVPAPAFAKRQAFAKLRTRAAIDFPSLNMAVALEIEKGVTKSVSLALGVIAAWLAVNTGVSYLLGRRSDLLR